MNSRRIRPALLIALGLHAAGVIAGLGVLEHRGRPPAIPIRLAPPAVALQLSNEIGIERVQGSVPATRQAGLRPLDLQMSQRLGSAAQARAVRTSSTLEMRKLPMRTTVAVPIDLAKAVLADAAGLDAEWRQMPAQHDPLTGPEPPIGASTPNKHAFYSRATAQLFRVNQDVLEAVAAARGRSGRHSTVEVWLAVNRQGRVIDTRVVRSSGYADLDRAAVGMVLAASPLPRMSEDMTQQRAEFNIPIVVVR
ncbi:MAG: energy transducer TonB [Gammaproteobacteria bacterium]|jgi:TonB family protein|nr:energy transducer TonB [Gammaproteobacteria bacterium]